MSAVVDERVVEMRFNNKDFEQNVKTSMSTLDKLKQKLNLKGASKGFEELGDASKKVNMNALGRSVDVVSAKFSALQVMGVTALANITNSVVNSAKAMISAITIDPVRDGLTEYETQMNAIQTILANTQKEGTDVERVNAALRELNTYADKTIYNFTEMTRNIGTFTAAGVKLDDSVSAIKGIANLAAVSGSNSQQASTAMYQLSQALASGTVKLMDWNSVVNAGMGGQVFQDALTRTSEHLQTGAKAAIEANGSFRESLSTGWLTTEVLTQTLDQFATAAETQEEYQAAVKKFVEQGYTKEEATQMADMAKTANDAATKVKTFRQLIDTLKEAMGSGWTTSWQLIIGDFEEAKEMWSNVSDFFSNIINNVSEFRNDVLKSTLGKGFTELANKITGVTEPVNKAIAAVEDLGSVVDDVLAGKFGNGDERFNALTEAGKNYYAVQNKVNEALGCTFRYTEDQIKAQDEALGTTTAETGATTELTDEKKKLIKEIANLSEEEMRAKGYTEDQINAFKELKTTAEKLGIPLNDFIDNMDQINGRWLLLQSFVNIGKSISAVVGSIGKAWTDLHGALSVDDLGDKFFNAIGAFHSFTASLIPTDETLGKLERTFKGVFAILDIISTVAGGTAKFAFRGLNAVLNAFDLDLLDVTAGIGDAAVAFRDFLFSNDLVNKGFEALDSGVKMAVEAFTDLVDAIENIPQVQEFIENFKNIDWSEIGSNVVEGLKNGLEAGISSVPDILIEIGQSMLSAIKGVLGIHSPSTEMYDIAKNAIAGLVNGLKDGITDAASALNDVGSNLLSEARKLDLGRIFTIGSIGASVIAGIVTINKIIDAMDKFATPFEKFGKILGTVNESIKTITESFSKNLKAKAFKTRAEGIKSMAIAIGILAASVYALAQLDQGALARSVAAIAVLSGILVVLALVVNKLSKATVTLDGEGRALKLDGLKTGLAGIGVALLMLAAVVKIMGGMKPDEMMQGFIGLAGVIVAISIVLKTFGKCVKGESAKNIDKAGMMIKKMSVALILMVAAIKLIGLLSAEDLVKGVRFMGVFIVFTGLLSVVTKLSGKGVSKLGGMMAKMAIAMGLMVGVCKLAGMLSAEEILKGAAFALGFIIFTTALKRAIKSKDDAKYLKMAGVIASMALALTMIVAVCKLVSMLSAGELIKGSVAVVAFGALLVTLVNAVKATGPEATKIGGTLLAMTAAIGILAGICVLMSLMDVKSLAKGLTVVGLLSGMMTAMVWATRGASDCKKNLIVMTAAIAVMATSVAALSLLDSSKLIGATACLSALMATFALMSKASGAAGSSIKSMVAMTVVVGALAGIVYMLAQLPVETTLPTVTALSALMLSLSASMLIMSKAGNVSARAVVAAAGMAFVVTALGAVITLLSQNGMMNVPLDAVVSLSALLLALSTSCVILSKVGPMAGAAASGAKSLMIMLGVVSAVILGLGALVSHFADESELDKLVTTLSKLGEALGTFFGSIIGGFLNGATDGLPEVADNLKEFINTFSGIDNNAAEKVNSLINALSALGSASLKNAIASFLGHGLGDFGAQIGDFADQMNTAADAVAGISDPGLDNLKAIADIGQLFGELQSTIKPTGGILAGIATYDIGDFGWDIGTYARNLNQAASAVAEISDEGLTNLGTIADIGMAFGKLQNTIEPTDGLVTLISEKSLGDFGWDIGTYARNLNQAASFVAQISDTGLTNLGAIADIGTVFSDLQSTLDPTDGIVTWLSKNDLGDFGEQISTYTTNLNTAATAVAELSDVGITNLSTVADIGTAFSDLQKSVGDATDLFDILTKNTLDGFGEEVKKYVESIKTASDTVSGENAVNEDAITKAKDIGDLLIELQEAIPEEGWFDGKVDLGEFADRIGRFGDAIGSLNEAASKGDLSKTNAVITFANSLKAFTQDMTDGEMATLDNFPTTIGYVAEGIAAYYGYLNGVDTAVVASSINSAYKIKSFISSLSNFSSDGIENFKVEDLGQSLSDYAGKVASMDFTQIAGSLTVASRLATFIKGLSELDTSGVSSFKKAVSTLGQTDTSNVAKAFSSASGDITSAGNSIVESLSKGISSKSSEATSAASGVIDKMNSEIMHKASVFLAAGTALILKLAAGIRENSSYAESAANSAVSNAANSIRGFYGSFHESGSYVGIGLINGLNSQYQAVYNAGYRLGQAAILGERAGQQSHSPSKLAEQSGVWVGEGLIIGVDSMGSKVYEAGESLGENVTSSLSSVISKASDLFEMSMDAEPVISPVVDLTNVKAASNSMDSMFSDLSIGTNANLRAVDVMMSNRGQNGNSDVVAAINRLGKKLSNMGNTYNSIDGVTYDESSSVSNAIQTLTRAVVVEGRR
ncbi:tape measure domain [uncultured Clostridium sp.]|uniref:tape measure protein n=1 Tax=uncultured Clostridium sp. TaxID=59620 RepID=UPI0008217126|nr:tape measure protein [uncultured Clostridium sp.]SCK01629.1 tape measure domain [uncultured Clostridium sp.]